MNRIQKLSQDLICERLKLQMGLDPRLDIEPRQLKAMWAELQRERRAAHSGQATKADYFQIDRAA